MQKEEKAVLIQTAEAMKGDCYNYAGRPHYIRDWNINEERGRFYLKTDKHTYDRTLEDAMGFLNGFEPVPKRQISKIPPPEDQGFRLPAMTVDQAVTSRLKDILLENIENVKKDKAYIPQAQAIKENVDSVLNLAKTEIEYLNALHRINRD